MPRTIIDLENINSHKGMSDRDLELITSTAHTETGPAKWKYWASEIYSFGKCFRSITNYPAILPLYVYSDHGVSTSDSLQEHELTNNARVHLTWSPLKTQKYKDLPGKSILLIPHPWVIYRKKAKYAPLPDRKGTLVFFSHHAPGLKYENHDTDEYFNQLKSLPEKYHPITLCMHMHDINAGYHEKLRKHGIPIVTAGNTQSIYFVDHFYQILQQFAYASSQTWGSQTAYCIEFGLPYFFFGEKPTLINLTHDQLPKGEVNLTNQKLEQLFSKSFDTVTTDQKEFIESFLGMNSEITPKGLSKILWQEFFHHWKDWPNIVFNIFKVSIKLLLKKMRLLNYLKKLKQITSEKT